MRIGTLGSQDRVIFRLNRHGLFLVFNIGARRLYLSAGSIVWPNEIVPEGN